MNDLNSSSLYDPFAANLQSNASNRVKSNNSLAPFHPKASSKSKPGVREGTRELVIQALFVNHNPANYQEPFNFNAQVKFRHDIEADKPGAGQYVTNRKANKHQHDQLISRQSLHDIFVVNGFAMPDDKTLAESANGHQPLIQYTDQFTFKSSVLYPNVKDRGIDGRPIDIFNPRHIEPSSQPLNQPQKSVTQSASTSQADLTKDLDALTSQIKPSSLQPKGLHQASSDLDL